MPGDGFLGILQMAYACTLKARDESQVGGAALAILPVSTPDATHGGRLPCLSHRVRTAPGFSSNAGAGREMQRRVGVRSSSESGLLSERPPARSLRQGTDAAEMRSLGPQPLQVCLRAFFLFYATIMVQYTDQHIIYSV